MRRRSGEGATAVVTPPSTPFGGVMVASSMEDRLGRAFLYAGTCNGYIYIYTYELCMC